MLTEDLEVIRQDYQQLSQQSTETLY